MKGRHPANLCPNAKEGKPSCHTCGGGCHSGKESGAVSADMVAEITRKVLEQLGK